ncbi:MAG: alpha/beta hydrolase [Bradymonadales bacterium]|nr:alpha/beta hydrolase [Bradymonadales bacterium]
MVRPRRPPILVAFLAMGICSCGDPETAEGDAADMVDADAAAPQCDPSHRPILFVHGMLGAGDQFHNQAMRFANNGYCIDWIAAFDWNTLGAQDNAAGLDTAVARLMTHTGADRIDLVGHSMGGRLCYEYLDDAERAANVAHYAHVASLMQSGPAGPDGNVPTLNLWSDADTIIADKGNIRGATNVMVPGLDHAAVLTGAPSFEALYRHFNDGAEPRTTEFGSVSPIQLSGKVLALGDNTPAVGGVVAIYPVDAETGERLDESAMATFEVGEEGHWGPFEAAPGVFYEFEVSAAGTASPPTHYYREPFVRSSPLVYYRTLPDSSTLIGRLLGNIPADDGQAVLGVFFPNRALLAGRDSLRIEGMEVATDDFASAEETALALFFFDANGNGQTDLFSINTFELFPFLVGVDVFLPVDPPSAIEAVYNGRTLHAPNWPSASGGVSFVVFE